MRKNREQSEEMEELFTNSIPLRMGALQIFLLFPQILYELWEKKIKKNKVESVESAERLEQFEPLWLKPADMKSETEQEDARK